MIDSYEMMRRAIEANHTRRRLAVEPGRYAVVTLHRPSNVDDRVKLAELMDQLGRVSTSLPLVFAVHPRTRARLAEFGLLGALEANRRITTVEPLGYVEFMNLVVDAAAVITDSGGVQEESTYLGIPCLTLRENTERPVTVTEGSNRLVKPEQLVDSVADALGGTWPKGRRPKFWDGKAASRCVASLRARVG
jgi:UDP-N-acetylglucosamine 2-epimerase (non-hydrolysing)